MKLDTYHISYTKINSKWIKDLNVRPETIKLLKGNIEEKLHNIDLINDFLDMTPKVQGNKSKNRQMGVCQTKKQIHRKTDDQQSEKSTYGMGEIICKPYF